MNTDHRGRPPFTNEGRVEHKPSRPYENNPARQQQDKTNQQVRDTLKNR